MSSRCVRKLLLLNSRCSSFLWPSGSIQYKVSIISSLYTLAPTKPSWHLHFNRHFSTTPSLKQRPSIVYSGPLTRAIMGLKVFSISTAALAILLNPILIYFGNPATPFIARVGIGLFVTCVGVSTTAILQMFIKGYVTRLFYDPSSDMVAAETLTLLGRRRLTSFHISDARPPDSVSAFSTFQGGGRHFFMHTEIFEDAELLRKLLGSYAVFEKIDKK